MNRIPIITLPDLPPTVEIHAHPCTYCPSVAGDDPWLADMAAAPRVEQVASVFRCGWRPGKLCRGYCDRLGVTEADL